MHDRCKRSKARQDKRYVGQKHRSADVLKRRRDAQAKREADEAARRAAKKNQRGPK